MKFRYLLEDLNYIGRIKLSESIIDLAIEAGIRETIKAVEREPP